MRNLFYQTWKEAAHHIRSSEGVIIPFGSVEEHGFHLPMGTDTILADAIVDNLCQSENLYYYPCITFGQVWSAREYEGTVSIDPESLLRYGHQVLDSVLRAKPKRIFLYSFHNGNHGVINTLLRQRAETNLYHIHVSGLEKKAKHILTTQPWNGNLWHAGELETSLMLYLAKDLVHMEHATEEFPDVPAAYALRPVSWRSFCHSGAFGAANAATAEKGKAIFSLLHDELIAQIRSVVDRER